MNMFSKLFDFKWIIMLSLLFFSSCMENAAINPKEKSIIESLLNKYKDGSIESCQYNNQIVYTAQLNAYDAGSVIFNVEGKQIADCNYAWGKVDKICEKISSCEAVYTVKDNIWGKPSIDKYNLIK